MRPISLTRETLTAALVVAFLMAGCSGSDPTTTPTGAGGEGVGDGGSGNAGNAGGEAGGGSDPGGSGGEGGEGGSAPDWGTKCLNGCSKLDACFQQNVCATVLNTNCGGTPPPQPSQCLVECVADTLPPGECMELNMWLAPSQKPMAPSDFARCAARCPGPAADPSSGAPAYGIALTCAAEPTWCATQLNDCVGDAGCQSWYLGCTSQCTEPTTVNAYPSSAECWRQCTMMNAANNQEAAALTQCLCTIQTSHANQGPPVRTWVGTADCSDVIYAHMNACAL